MPEGVGVELEDLKKAGLTEYESKAYICLLRRGAQEGSEVASNTDVPKTRVYDVLRSLVDKGLASLIQKKPMKFSPTEPDVGLKSLFEERRKRIQFHEDKAIESLKDIEREKAKKPKIEEKVNVIFGFDKMYSHWIERCEEAWDEIVVLSVGEEIPNMVKVKLKRLVERGVDIKFLASKYDEENEDILKEYTDLGFDVRHYDTAQEYTFSVSDGESCMLNVRNPKEKGDRISIFFEVSGLAQALREYFYSMWDKAEEVKFPRSASSRA